MLNLNRIKGLLREKNLTQTDIANLIGCSVPTVNNKLNGKSKFDSDELKLIADILEYKIDDFF